MFDTFWNKIADQAVRTMRANVMLAFIFYLKNKVIQKQDDQQILTKSNLIF